MRRTTSKTRVRRERDDSARIDAALDSIVPEAPTSPTTWRDHPASVDDGHLLEVQKDYAQNMLIGLPDGGYSVGIVANQPSFLAERSISTRRSKLRGLCFCDGSTFHSLRSSMCPVLPGTQQEFAGIIRHGAKLLYAFCEATVPK